LNHSRVLQNFDFVETGDHHFGQGCIDADRTVALQDFDAIDSHRIDGFDVVDPICTFPMIRAAEIKQKVKKLGVIVNEWHENGRKKFERT
jgi:hypothetical protein